MGFIFNGNVVIFLIINFENSKNYRYNNRLKLIYFLSSIRIIISGRCWLLWFLTVMKRVFSIPLIVFLFSLIHTGETTPSAITPCYTYKIIATYPHDRDAFTQGLIYQDGYFYESTEDVKFLVEIF